MGQKLTREMIFGSHKNNSQRSEIEEVKREEEIIEESVGVKTICYTDLSPDCLIDFREKQPFSMHDEKKMEEMKESIRISGIHENIIVRKVDEEKYEIISGHNRVRCAKELNLESVPAKVVEANDDEAKIIMIDTNLCKRENIPPVEKGYAYKMKLEALKNLKQEDLFPRGERKNGRKIGERCK